MDTSEDSIISLIHEQEMIRRLVEPVIFHRHNSWDDGPWKNEPDFECFIAETLPCVIKRAPLGHLNGYVGVPINHPLFGASAYTAEDPLSEITMHGGVTYTSPLYESFNYWFIGFDCAHASDYVPSLDLYGPERYKTFEYVKAECLNIAKQIKNKFGI